MASARRSKTTQRCPENLSRSCFRRFFLHTLLHGRCTSTPPATGRSSLIRSFSCKAQVSRSGADGIRTHALRRAKSEPYRRGRSPLFRNTCKLADFSVAHFVIVRRCSRGLVYYWCKRVLACCTTGRSPVAIVPRSRWATRHVESRPSSARRWVSPSHS